MKYVDGYVIPIPVKNLPNYRRLARVASRVWMEHGALAYCECAGDDLQVECGTPFTKQLKLKPDETAIFAWIVFKSKAHRDRVNARAMKDPRLACTMEKDAMPFDPKRMVYGGFKTLVEA